MASGEFRLRLTYAKSGRLRWLSHLEVTRTLERSVRRSGLPYAVTQGFHPHMKIAFGPALPVGTAGDREAVDVWLTRYVPAREALGAMSGATPPALAVGEARYVATDAPALSSGVGIGVYHVIIEGEGVSATRVQSALDRLIASKTLAVENRRKTKVYDLERVLPKEPRASDAEGGVDIGLVIRMGPEGSLRPETLIAAALEDAGIVGAVTSVARRDVLVEHKEGTWTRPA